MISIRYHTTLISIFNCPRGHNHLSKPVDVGMKPTTTANLTQDSGEDPASIATSSARAIAKLVRIHQEEYGMSRSHIFALYAVNVALFLLLDYDIFDISDPDCITLTSAFAVVTTRSMLGQEVRAVFRRSIRKRTRDGRRSLWAQLPEGLKEVLEDDSSSSSSSSEEEGVDSEDDGSSDVDVASGTTTSVETPHANHEQTPPPATSSERLSSMSTTDNGQGPGKEQAQTSKQRRTVPQQGPTGLCEMLCRYETMTLGRDDHVTGKR